MLSLPVFAAFENTHINSGNLMEDLIAVAETQLGYMEGSLEGTVQGKNDYTKYGEWYGTNMSHQPWCAMFVSWCANQAGIPTSVIPKHASCDDGMKWFRDNGIFSFSSTYGGTRTPQRGDIVYFGTTLNGGGYDSTHVGIVYKVDSANIHVLEGNSNYKVQTVVYKMSSSYVLGYGIPNYTLEKIERKPGIYVTTASSLNFRSKPSTSSTSLGLFPSGTILEITEIAEEKWGKTTYNGKTGWVSLDYCAACFSVTYNANGGKNPPKPQGKLPYSELTLTKETPSREGYSFMGWSTSPDGKTEYKAGDKYTKNENVTLYAVWQAKTYTVSYNANGGKNAPEAQTKKHGEALKLSVNIPTKEGYLFKGWSSSESGSVEYKSGGNYSQNASVTLYAVWELDRVSFTVSYNANGGGNAPASQSFGEGESINITTAVPVREGYLFEGWAYTKDSVWPEVFPGELYNVNSSASLYAVWSKNLSSLKLEVNEGGKVHRHVKDNTVSLKIKADEGNSISYISIDNTPVGLVGDLAERILTLDTAPHTVKVEFTKNNGLWINPFADVSAKAWYYTAIEYCYVNNIMTGVDETHFAPNATLTRGQFVTLIGRLHGVSEASGTLPFTDTAKNHYYYKYLIWAYNNKIVSGTAPDEFSPNASITREQLCVMLYNYEKFKGNVGSFGDTLLKNYSDKAKISSWAKEAVSWAVYNKIISGSDGMLLPRDNATRAQAAVIIKNHSS